jgi:16S rRNA C967 or C1407 C5-methylase (RsmB/RsmF family)
MNQDSFQRLIGLLIQFLNSETVQLSEKARKDRTTIHYYNEIVRYWNKINFIYSYTIKAVKHSGNTTKKTKAIYFLFIYRKFWENATFEEIINDFQPLQKSLVPILSKKSLLKFYKKLQTFSWKRAFSNKSVIEKISIDKAIPTFVLRRLKPYLQPDFILRNIEELDTPEELKTAIAIIEHQRNIKSDLKERVKTYLIENKIPFSEDPIINSMFLISSRHLSQILQTQFYKRGNLLILDKGSAYIVKLLSPGKEDYFLDMCAAPGIKTILLSNLAYPQNKIFAVDFALARVYQMKDLLKFYNKTNVSIINGDSIDPPLRESTKYDKILLDAPCTGSGTFSSHPELKWRQNRSFLYQNVTLQEKLLNSAVSLLKPGGILVYSTCSLYAEEGELQMNHLLDTFLPMDLPEYFSDPYRINDTLPEGMGRLFPALHGTKGFFVAKFKKKGA